MEKEIFNFAEIEKMLKDIYQMVIRRSTEKTEVNLTTVQAGLLYFLYSNKYEPFQQQLADSMAKDKSTILRLTKSLEDKDLIRKVPDKRDRRKNYLMVTKKGQEVIEVYINTRTVIFNQMVEDVSEPDIKACIRVINAVKEKLSKVLL